jgi:hypothetical protein
MATVAQLHAARATTAPLRAAAILRQVFAYLTGKWLYLGAVCSEFESYLRMLR